VGRKRHVLVDSEGLLHAVNVHAADIMDRDGIKLVLSADVRAQLQRMQLLWLDAGYNGRGTGKDGMEQTTTWRVETVKGIHWRRYYWVPNDIPPDQIDWSLYAPSPGLNDVGWGEFVRQLEYKANWYGRILVKIDRWYPSSKRCHACGHLLDSLSLDSRRWTCPACGAGHDRDVNAAKNILAVGRTVSAYGETVRPTKASARDGASQ
jgi:hypothetical protein